LADDFALALVTEGIKERVSDSSLALLSFLLFGSALLAKGTSGFLGRWLSTNGGTRVEVFGKNCPFGSDVVSRLAVPGHPAPFYSVPSSVPSTENEMGREMGILTLSFLRVEMLNLSCTRCCCPGTPSRVERQVVRENFSLIRNEVPEAVGQRVVMA
jgi:hypothetical protein